MSTDDSAGDHMEVEPSEEPVGNDNIDAIPDKISKKGCEGGDALDSTLTSTEGATTTPAASSTTTSDASSCAKEPAPLNTKTSMSSSNTGNPVRWNMGMTGPGPSAAGIMGPGAGVNQPPFRPTPITTVSSPPGMPSPMTSRMNKRPMPYSSSQTLLSANEYMSNLLQQKRMCDSMSDMSVSSVESPLGLVSNATRRTRTMSSNLSEVDSSSKGNLSRSSSTMSLVSNSGLGPLDSVLRRLRQKMSGQIFSGWYRERRFVDAIDRYRDLVVVDSTESVLIKQIKFAMRKSIKLFGENAFVGLSIVDDEPRIYTSLGSASPDNISSATAEYPFGRFWFQVRQIGFIPNVGFTIELFVIRPFLSSDNEACWKCKQREMEAANQPPVKIDSLGGAFADMKTRLESVAAQAVEEYWHPGDVWSRGIRPMMTRENASNAFRILCVLAVTLFTAIVAAIKHAANFALRALHEMAFIVDRSTPLALGTLNIFSKIVGGFYLLVAMIWRDTTKPNPAGARAPLRGPPNSLPALTSTPANRMASPGKPAMSGPSAAFQARPDMGLRARPTPPQRVNPMSAMDSMYSSHRDW